MKAFLYHFLKTLIRTGFFCYFREIRMNGIDQVPTDRPVMLLSNHQNALLDPLLYAAFAKGTKPYFLTRSDVFGNRLLAWVFKGLRMIPIYRIRDGRETLHRNQQIFDQCAGLFSQGEHILLFPEANHNLRRQVRPLSKGFTRILAHSFTQYPEMDIWIIPVGVNYQKADTFPDRAAFYFGKAFSARQYWSASEGALSVPELKERVFRDLTELTTHIPVTEDYDSQVRILEYSGVDLTDPQATRSVLTSEVREAKMQTTIASKRINTWDAVFNLLNAPVWLPWHFIVKKIVWEPEFMSTFRFPYSLMAFLLYYPILGWILTYLMSTQWAVGGVMLLFLHNLAYVKLSQSGKSFP